MLETSKQTNWSIVLNEYIDRLIRQTFDGIFLDYLDGLFAGSQSKLITLRTVSRKSKRHLAGHVNRTGSLVAESKLRLVLSEAVHIGNADTEVMFACRQDIRVGDTKRVGNMQFFPRVSNVHNRRNRHYRRLKE